jgi:hypothetical protein
MGKVKFKDLVVGQEYHVEHLFHPERNGRKTVFNLGLDMVEFEDGEFPIFYPALRITQIEQPVPKQVQLNGILVTEADIGREIDLRDFEGFMYNGVYTVEGLASGEVHVTAVSAGAACVLTYENCKASWVETITKSIIPTPTPITTTPILPRQQAATSLREAYAKCEDLGMLVKIKNFGLRITYEPDVEVY